MTFLLPIGLLALLALPLIVALHLVRQRRTRRRVPTTVLWQSVRVPPEQRQRNLPLTLLLLLHLLAALALALALANPALLPFGQNIPTHTALVLDTSTSMAATDESPSRFAAAQSAALAAIDDLGENDTLALVTLSDPPRLLATGGAADRARLAALVEGLAPAGVGADLAGALHIANGTLSTERQQRIVILTDTSLAAPTAPLSTPAPLEWRVWGNSAPNAAIVAFASRRLPAGDIALYARVANYSDASLARSLHLSVDGDTRDEQTIRVPAGGSEERTWYVQAGEVAELALDGEDALPGDDRAVLPLGRARSVRVRLISGQPDTALERVLAALPGYNVTVASAYDPAAPPVDVTVFNGMLPAALPSGALIAVNPPMDTVHFVVGARVSGERAVSTALDPAFARIDLSSVQWGGRHPLESIPSTLQPALTTDTSAPLVLRGLLADRPAVVWAFDVESSNLPAKLAFPLLAAASLDALTTGALPPTLPPGSLAPPAPLSQPDGRPLPADARLTDPGLYRLRDEQGQPSGGGVAVNLGDDVESNLLFRPPPELMAAPAALDVQPTAATGWRMWPLLVWLALAALAAEWIYHGWRGRPARAS
ncbi:MAG TPA: VWA domain-containing protein [Herpetosiphonaceae bacterium]|nr:VWA domain-containing protein [Herpetosiphonaceae bacterium]